MPSIGAFQPTDRPYKNLTATINISSRRAASSVKPLRASAESRRSDSVSPIAATTIAAPKTGNFSVLVLKLECLEICW